VSGTRRLLPWIPTVGHSPNVAALVVAAAGEQAQRLALAGLLHDVGRVAVPNGIWDKRGPLDARERDRMRTHTFETERVLARAPIFAEVVSLASMAHERLDGGGYHRGQRTSALSREARLLAAADTYVALTADRPHRLALPSARAAEVLAREAREGRLCADAVDAVLGAAGHVRGRRAAVPNALAAREVEMVRFIARGLIDKDIAARTGLSASTVKRHLENVFGKVGLRTRAAVSVWALENDLLQ
jgi:HD-GYP domain-containing protein (c-di-GMP phosphodiesterase class II)